MAIFPARTPTIMDPVTADLRPATVINSHILYVGMVLESVDQARQFVNAYAIHHNFAVKNGFPKKKDQALLLLCKCAKKPYNTRKLPMTKGKSDNGLTRQKEAQACFVTVLGWCA
ncbi:hypothetical protein V1521DRAFT_424915 [Lipomyces starkeyi]